MVRRPLVGSTRRTGNVPSWATRPASTWRPGPASAIRDGAVQHLTGLADDADRRARHPPVSLQQLDGHHHQKQVKKTGSTNAPKRSVM